MTGERIEQKPTLLGFRYKPQAKAAPVEIVGLAAEEIRAEAQTHLQLEWAEQAAKRPPACGRRRRRHVVAHVPTAVTVRAAQEAIGPRALGARCRVRMRTVHVPPPTDVERD